ncbi:MAG: hypothetical protein GYA24_10200 [Candidatus Lokiarchaeota archaeon]|nr:hypothetical protein [Candidatus Lokiarchaeota archaeon]
MALSTNSFIFFLVIIASGLSLIFSFVVFSAIFRVFPDGLTWSIILGIVTGVLTTFLILGSVVASESRKRVTRRAPRHLDAPRDNAATTQIERVRRLRGRQVLSQDEADRLRYNQYG